MSPEQLALRRAKRLLKEWIDERHVPEGDQRLDYKITTFLSKAVIAAEKAVRRSARVASGAPPR